MEKSRYSVKEGREIESKDPIEFDFESTVYKHIFPNPFPRQQTFFPIDEITENILPNANA